MSKNKFGKAIVVCGVLAVLSGCASKAGQTGSGSRDYITVEEVKATVLENAGYLEDQVRFVRIHLDTDNGAAEYEVEFLCETAEYDYTVHAETGEILSMNFEIGDYDIAALSDDILTPADAPSGEQGDAIPAGTQPGTQNGMPSADTPFGEQSDAIPAGTQSGTQNGMPPADTPSGVQGDVPPAGTQSGNRDGTSPADMPAANTQTGTEQYIGAEAAKQAALEHAGLNADGVRFLHAHLELDDGRWIYDVEFHDNTTEYDYEIDARSGEVLKFDRDTEYDRHGGDGLASEAQISAEDAKRIALEYAGIAETDTQRLKVEYDYDDGRAEYEVKWYAGRMEYSCDVDAVTGEILSFEKEQD